MSAPTTADGGASASHQQPPTPAAAQRSATVRVSILGARGVAAMFAHGVASRGVSAGGREWEAASGGMQASAKRYAEKFGSDFIL